MLSKAQREFFQNFKAGKVTQYTTNYRRVPATQKPERRKSLTADLLLVNEVLDKLQVLYNIPSSALVSRPYLQKYTMSEHPPQPQDPEPPIDRPDPTDPVKVLKYSLEPLHRVDRRRGIQSPLD